MGRYDNAIRQLLADNPQQLATFLFGPLPIGVNARYAQTEYAPETMRADSVIELLRGGSHVERLGQVEFQLRANHGDIEPRLVRYWALMHNPKGPVPEQYVVVLDRKGGRLSGRYDTANLQLTYTPIHLWETSAEGLLDHPLLFPFATLGQAESASEVFDQVVHRCNLERRYERRNMLLSTAAILATIVLDQPTIESILQRRPAMPIDFRELPIYEWGLEEGLETGRELGREQGLEQGLEQGHHDAVTVLLSERFGSLTSVEQLETKRIMQVSTLSFDQQLRIALTATSLSDFQSRITTPRP